MRDGKFALMTPVRTSTLGRCVASTRWMPAARAICASRCSDSSTSRADDDHQVGELVDHDDDVRAASATRISSPSVCPGRGFSWNDSSPAAMHFATPFVELLDVAHAALAPSSGSALPSCSRRRQRGGRALRIRDDLGDQVRNAVVDRELEHLRDRPAGASGRRASRGMRMRAEQRVQEDALARAGRARDEQVRHLARGPSVTGLPKMSLPIATVSTRPSPRKLSDSSDLAQIDDVALAGWAPRSRPRTCPGIGAMMRIEIARSASARSSDRFDDAVDLDPRRRLELVHRDHGTGVHLHDAARTPRSRRASSRGSASS